MVKSGGLEEMLEREPKILSIDIETSPIKAYTWGPKWETNLIEFLDYSKILSYSAKWLGGKQETKGLNDYKGYKKGLVDDKEITKDLRRLLDEADIVIAQNGRDFDIKTMNARFVHHGLTPPSPYKVIDTKVEAKKYLRLPSYALDDMGEYFGLGRKMKHEGFELWKKCMAGEEQAWKTMKKYNAQDVLLMEKFYLKLRPYMKTHPNLGVYLEEKGCPKCGSDKLQSRGYARTTSIVYRRYQCQDCGGWGRSNLREKSLKTIKSE